MSGKIKTEWNLKQFYTTPKDPKIEKDVRTAERAYAIFSKKYKNTKKYLSSDKELLKALKD